MKIENIINNIYSRANEVDEGFVSRGEVLGFIQDFIDDINDRKSRWRYEEVPLDKSNTTTVGGETFTLPENIKFLGNESIDTIYIEGEKPMMYIGQDEMARKLVGLGRSTLNGSVTSGDSSILLYDGSNFPEEGTGFINGNEFTWTGKTGNTLTGVSGILNHSSGSVVWSMGELGSPTHYTILAGVGQLFPAPDFRYATRPLVIAYKERLEYPESEDDEMPVPYVSACKDYCLMAIEDKKGRGSNSQQYERRYEQKIQRIILLHKTGQPQRFSSARR